MKTYDAHNKSNIMTKNSLSMHWTRPLKSKSNKNGLKSGLEFKALLEYYKYGL